MMLTVQLRKTRLTDPQHDGLELGATQPDLAQLDKIQLNYGRAGIFSAPKS